MNISGLIFIAHNEQGFVFVAAIANVSRVWHRSQIYNKKMRFIRQAAMTQNPMLAVRFSSTDEN